MTTLQHGRIAIRVAGLPIPQGSKSAAVIKGRAVIRDSNAKTLKPWRDHVRATAEDATRYHDTITGPVAVWLYFTFERPKSHYRTGRNAHLLRPNAPPFPGRPCGDIDKLQRAVFDALTDAAVWTDDTQAVDLRRVRKVWAGEHEYAAPAAGVDIILEEIA